MGKFLKIVNMKYKRYENKANISSIIFLLLSVGILLYALSDMFYQIKSDIFPRITTIILFLYAAFTFYIVFSKIISNKN